MPELKLSEIEDFKEEILRKEIKETPKKKREIQKDYDLKNSDINFYISNPQLGTLFEEASTGLNRENFQLLSNYIVSDIASFGEKGISINNRHLSELILMVANGKISSRGAKDILVKIIETGEDPKL